MHRDEDLATIATFYRRVQWSALTVGVLWVVWLLAPILSPFVIAAILGWLGDPMVDRLEARRISRNTAVILVFGAMTVVLLVVAVLLIPVLEDQVMVLVNSLPGYRDWFVGTALPWVEHRTGLQILSWLDPERLFTLLRFTVQVAHRTHLAAVMRGMRHIPEVTRIARERGGDA